MDIQCVITSKMHTNTYIVSNGERAFIVDPGGKAAELDDMLSRRGLRLEAVLLTHAHFDHIGAVSDLVVLRHEDDPKVFLHEADLDFVTTEKSMGRYMRVEVKPFVPDVLLKGGETLTVAGLKVDVISTPGHTPGGVCYKVEDKLFTGDTVFYLSYGRTDLYDGSFAALKNSIINKLFRIEGDYALLPGHGEPTSLDFERANNPILRDKTSVVR